MSERRRFDVVVVGGGVVGCAVAWSLAREGVSVALLERDALAAHASGAAAGMLLPLGEAEGPGGRLDLGLRSLALFPELCGELRERSGIDPELQIGGALHVATSSKGERGLREKARLLAGFGAEWLDRSAARAAEPALAPGVRGALFAASEGHVRSALLARACAAAAADLGARIEVGVAVTGLVGTGGRVRGVRSTAGEWSAARVVVCTGAWASACAEWLAPLGVSLQIPVEPLRGQIVALDAPSPPLRSIAAGEHVYLVARRDGQVWVGATEERVGFDARTTAAGVGWLLARAPELAPALAGATFRGAWAGLRPTPPDGLPLVGPVPGLDGLLLAAGHHRNGVLLAPLTGRLVADLVAGKELPAEAAPLRVERF